MNKLEAIKIIELLIKLDLSIDSEHEMVKPQGLALLYGFTEKQRKQAVKEAIGILNKEKEDENN